MNETYDVLAKWSRKKKTQKLADKLTRAMRGHDHRTVLSALLMVTVDAHLDANRGEDDVICVPCTNASLTELVQTLRGFHDQVVDMIPSGKVVKGEHRPAGGGEDPH